MSNTLVTGPTGSGKSYRVVVTMLDALAEDRKVFSNIKLSVEDKNYIYIDEIEVNKFLKYIEKTFSNASMESAKEEFKSTQYANALIVLDEVQFLGFKSYNKAVSDWLTLQRHFGQDIILITQVLKNLAPLYQDLCHFHFDYTSPHNRVRKSHFQYKKYDGVKGEYLHTKLVKPEKEIFNIYKTGKSESAYHPLLFKLLGVVALLAVVFGSLFFRDSGILSIAQGTTYQENQDKNISIKKSEAEHTEHNSSIVDDNSSKELVCNTFKVKPLEYIFSEDTKDGYHVCQMLVIK